MTIKIMVGPLAWLMATATVVLLSIPTLAVDVKRGHSTTSTGVSAGKIVWPTKASDQAATQRRPVLLPTGQRPTDSVVQKSSQPPARKPSTVDLASSIKSAAVKSGYRFLPDIPYVPEGKPCTGDFYLPAQASEKACPAVLVVHGGAWVIGSKTDSGEADIAQRLARHGYVVFSIDYRLISDGALYPASIRDTKDALGFLNENARKLNIDPNRIGIYGGSAGGMMSMLAAYTPNSGVLEADHYKGALPKPKAVVAYCPITDLRNLEKTWIFRYLDDTPYHSPEKFAQASPISYVTTAVPTMCVHGDDDPMVPAEQSEQLVKALKEAGVPAEFVLVPNVRHAFHEQPGPGRELAFARLLSFFNTYLKQ